MRTPRTGPSGIVHPSGAPGAGWRVSPDGNTSVLAGRSLPGRQQPRNPMSMPPRSRTGSGPLVARLIALAVIVLAVAVLAAARGTPQRAWDSFFPVGGQTPATDRALASRSLYDIVFTIGVAVFVIV